MLKEVLEVENTLSWGYDARRSKYVFPLHNLNYEPEQTGVEAKREKARAPDVRFLPKIGKRRSIRTFSRPERLQSRYNITISLRLKMRRSSCDCSCGRRTRQLR